MIVFGLRCYEIGDEFFKFICVLFVVYVEGYVVGIYYSLNIIEIIINIECVRVWYRKYFCCI